jgi:hypothetical protein
LRRCEARLNIFAQLIAIIGNAPQRVHADAEQFKNPARCG